MEAWNHHSPAPYIYVAIFYAHIPSTPNMRRWFQCSFPQRSIYGMLPIKLIQNVFLYRGLCHFIPYICIHVCLCGGSSVCAVGVCVCEFGDDLIHHSRIITHKDRIVGYYQTRCQRILHWILECLPRRNHNNQNKRDSKQDNAFENMRTILT